MSYVPALLEIRTLDANGNQVFLCDLLNLSDGITLKSWRPKRAQLKGGGVYQDSPFSDGRRLVHAVYDNVTESLILQMVGDNPDGLYWDDSVLTDALNDAISYGTAEWNPYPVFLTMIPRGATNEQYALIANGRTEEFAEPFGSLMYQFKSPRSVADEIPLIIEREHWLETPPTLSVATDLSAVQAYPESFCLKFANDGDIVACGSDATIDDLTAGANGCTFEAWIKLNKIPSATARALTKGQWALQVQADTGNLSAFILSSTTNASSTGKTNRLADLEWHHIAMTYINTGGRTISLWIDGIESSYTAQIAAVGTLTTDAASVLYLGDDSDGDNLFPGLIGWSRLSDTRRYTANFTPPSRCSPPDVDGNTVAQWNMQEGQGTAVDNAEGTAASDGVITNAIWSSARDEGDSCGTRNYGNVDSNGDREVTSDDEVYVSNKHTFAQITNIHISTAGANLIDSSWPATIHSATSAASTYFGIASSSPNSGPFDSLVFDIGTAQVGATLVYEYWNGSTWTSLTVTDNTNFLQNTGVHSIHWIPPSTWTAASPGGSLPSGYYIRIRTTVTGSTNPTQQNRNPYTICWPYVELQAAAVPGEIRSLARLWLHGKSGSSTSLPAPRTMLMSLRSVSRGGAFTPYINIADTQLVPGTVIKAAGGTAYAADLLSPTGRRLTVTATAPSTPTYFSIEFLNTIASQYRGKFLVFLRARSVSDWDIDISFHRDISAFRSNVFHSVSKPLSDTGTSVQVITSFGEVIIPKDVQEFEISIGAETTSGSSDLYVTDLILLPADEWVARFDSKYAYDGSENYAITPMLKSSTPPFYLDIDHTNTKGASSSLIDSESGVVKDAFDPQVHEVFFQNGVKQRIWFFQNGRMNGTTSTAAVALPFNSLSVQAFRNAQYKGFRGSQ